MNGSIVLTIFFGIFGAAGTVASIYYGVKSNRLEKSKISLDFQDLSSACSDISDFLKKEKFIPDVVYTPGAKSGILAELLSQKFTHEPLVVVGSLEWKDTGLNAFNSGNSVVIASSKWRILIPDLVLSNTERRLVLIDDMVMSGDGLKAIVSELVKAGFKAENIKTTALVTTFVAIANKKGPDYHWRKTNAEYFYFPWGKTR